MYKIVRMYFDESLTSRTIKTGLTEEEAMKHCSNPETSSSTCTSYTGRKRTERKGAWFDAFQKQ